MVVSKQEARMKRNIGVLRGATIVAVAAIIGMISAASAASIPSSPAEMAATAKLNNEITERNAAAAEKYRSMQAEYLERKAQNDALHAQYQADLNRIRDTGE
jgi:hypothetical protein